MLRKISCSRNNYEKKLFSYVAKGGIDNKKRTTVVRNIINQIRKNKNRALLNYSNKFDNNTFADFDSLKVSSKEMDEALSLCSKEFHNSVKLAAKRITNYQKKLMPKNLYYKDETGTKLGSIWSPLASCGLYVPGGKALYPSSVLMNGIPAKIAGVKRIVITTPASKNELRPEILMAAKEVGINEIYKIGGAQAIAALTFGTESIKKVDKIVGPGNAFVACAKKEVFGDVGIDMVAGPSEVSIVADKTANPDLVAADLIAQAEHDIYAQSILITDNENLISLVNLSLKKQLKQLPKKKIASQSLRNFGLAILAKNKKKIPEIINTIAPEHLELCTSINNKIIKEIKNAGSIFIGKFSPEAIGDYIAGPNHVLPTSGSARFSSGLSVNDFLKRHSLIKITKTGIERLGPSVINLAKHENLDGHANSVKLRLKKEN